MSEFLALCCRLPGNELVAAECRNLTGGLPDKEGVALCHSIERVVDAAYVHTGLRLIAQAETLPGLLEAVAGQHFSAQAFRIEYIRLSPCPQVHRDEAVVALANVIPASPDLRHPKHRFLLVVGESRLWFGEILAETSRSYRLHEAKPGRTSSSLPARLARALVNLVSPPAQSILDPCCGTGSILLEAQVLGLQAAGADRSPRMVQLARQNLAFFGYSAEVYLADARKLFSSADAVVTDLPYGKFSRQKPLEIQEILSQSAQLAPVGLFVASRDISEWLVSAGYQDIEVFQVPKRSDFTRFIHRARSAQFLP